MFKSGSSDVHLRTLVIVLVTLSGLLPILFFTLGVGAADDMVEPGLRLLPIYEQVALVAAVYLVKPLYMLAALVLALLLWRQTGLARMALFWSLVFFLSGELACWINIQFFTYESVWLEYLHSFLMVGCLGFLAFTVMESVDHGLIRFGDSTAKCALTVVCHGCNRNVRGGCLLRRLFQWAIPLIAVVSFMPMFAQPRFISYNTMIFGVLRNLTHPLPVQLFELRFSPVAALVLLVAAWLFLVWRGHTQDGLLLSKVFIASGLGFIGFSFLRLAFLKFYWDNLVWFVFWEEVTELILVVGVIVAIWFLIPELMANLRLGNI